MASREETLQKLLSEAELTMQLYIAKSESRDHSCVCWPLLNDSRCLSLPKIIAVLTEGGKLTFAGHKQLRKKLEDEMPERKREQVLTPYEGYNRELGCKEQYRIKVVHYEPSELRDLVRVAAEFLYGEHSSAAPEIIY